MTVGPTTAASTITITTIMPNTASLFLSSRRHASRQNDEPTTNSAPMTESMSSVGANFGCCSLFITDPRIEKAVRDIHEQIQNQDRDRDERHDSDDQRFVAIETSVDEIIAETGKREHSLDYDGAGDQESERRSRE